jgi:hypothetical protein
MLDWLRPREEKPQRPVAGVPYVPLARAPEAVSSDKTGQTIFDDRPLRLRHLTTDAPDAGDMDPAGVPGAFKIRLAKLSGFRRAAGTLVERRYSSRGYQVPGQQADPFLFTFLAYDEGLIVGTVGVRLDSEKGLSADELYRDELDILRQAGCRVCEFTRLAVDIKAANKPVLAGLFHTAYLFASAQRGFTHAVIEVNPRHVSFYRRGLGFEPIGEERMNKRVQAPAVLLCVPFERISEGVVKEGGQGAHATARSLFSYTFDSEEEQGILKRLGELDTDHQPSDE